MAKKIFPLVVVLLIFIAGLPLLNSGLPPTHDGEYHVIRFYEFDKALREGNLYPRWASDLNSGYGVPLFNYVYPLPSYVASFFHAFNISFIDALKLNMFFASILGAVFFYLWARGFWGNWGGMVGTVFYTYSPYHFLDIYIRGSVGEVWALAFFPAFLWGVTKFVWHKKQHFLPISSIFLALIIFSHNILAIMFFPFAISYCGFLLLRGKGDRGSWARLPARQGDWGRVIFIFFLGIGLSAVFWLPAIFEKQHVVGLEVFGFENHFPDLYQLLIPSWGSGFSGQDLANSLSFQIGMANLFAVFLSLVLVGFRHSGLSRISNRLKRFWSRYAPQNDGREHIIIFLLVWFFLIFFLMLEVSLPIWQMTPFMNYFQFPWRFLSLEILVASFLAGSVVYFWKSKILVIFLISLAFFLGIGYAKPAYYHSRDDNYYITRSNFIDGTNSPGNAFNTKYFKGVTYKSEEKIAFIEGKGKVNVKNIKAESYSFSVTADSKSKIQVNTAYFPGWTVFVNNSKTETEITKNGLFSFNIPKGNHEVKIKFENTPVRDFAISIFLISAGILVVLFIKPYFATIKR